MLSLSTQDERQLQADATEKLGKGSIDRLRNRGEQPHRQRAGPKLSATVEPFKSTVIICSRPVSVGPSDSVGCHLAGKLRTRSKLLRFFFRPLRVAKTARLPLLAGFNGRKNLLRTRSEVNQTDGPSGCISIRTPSEADQGRRA
jgi:hypothetical protein